LGFEDSKVRTIIFSFVRQRPALPVAHHVSNQETPQMRGTTIAENISCGIHHMLFGGRGMLLKATRRTLVIDVKPAERLIVAGWL
ncbi:unnamed protein product, partial [Fusarium fujikuroi]